MARNGTGTYTLPAGNPFITGSVISSTTMNNTLSDIAAALTASVANDGQTPILANQDYGGFNLTNVGAIEASGSVTISGAAATNRRLLLRTGTTNRWAILANSVAETGSNAGSNLQVISYNDAGAQLAITAGITRSTGVVSLGATPTFPSASAASDNTQGATTEWVRDYAPAALYNPTTSNNSNVITAATPYGLYQRVGNIVQVYVRFGTTPSSTGSCSFQFSLPVASNIGAVSEVVGSGYSLNSLAVDAVAVQGVVANPGRVQVSWSATGTTVGYANVNFAYEVH